MIRSRGMKKGQRLMLLAASSAEGEQKWRVFAIAALVISASTTCAFAGTTTGNELLFWCNDRDSPFHQGACDGYINGAVDVATYVGSFCAPADVSLGQTREMVVKYLKANPEIRNLAASQLVWDATRTFACHKIN